ncbi:MAG: hypothetical protein ACJAWQ_001599 [Paraglaciecola sp.]|mgnify:FL=1|jgi:hypothetical protein
MISINNNYQDLDVVGIKTGALAISVAKIIVEVLLPPPTL